MLSADLAAVEGVFAAPVVRSAGLFLFGTPLPIPSPGGPLIPDSLLGKTLAWDCATQAYFVTTGGGAPATGVRLVLYQLAANGGIVCPATAIGQLDLLDASTVSARAMRATATNTKLDAPFVDYTLTHITTDSPGVSSASGLIGDGHERLAFQWTVTPGSPYTSVSTMQLDDSARDFHVLLQNADQMGVDTYSSTLDLTLRKAELTVELTGSASWFNTFRGWDELVTVNGQSFAHVGGTLVTDGGQPTITPAGAVLFTGAQRQLLLQIVSAPDTLGGNLRRVLAAATRLVNAR